MAGGAHVAARWRWRTACQVFIASVMTLNLSELEVRASNGARGDNMRQIDIRVLRMLLASIVCIASLQIVSEAQPANYRAIFVDRLSRLQSVIVTFHQETFLTPPPEIVKENNRVAVPGNRAGPGRVREGLFVINGRFAFLNGNARYDDTCDPITVKRFETEGEPFHRKEIFSFARDRAEEFIEHAPSRHQVGGIFDHKDLPNEYPIDLALGLRCGYEQWLTESVINSATFEVAPEGLVVMRIKDSEDDKLEYHWAVDSHNSNALVRFWASRGSTVLTDINCSSFTLHDGLALPEAVRAVYNSTRGGKLSVVRTVTVNSIKYDLGSSDNIVAKYYIEYPAGALVTDMRLKVPMRAATTRSFSDKEIYLAAAARDARSRPLPQRSGRTKWWIGVWALLLLTLCWYWLQRSRNRSQGTRG